MSVLDDFDKIVTDQVQDEAYQQKLELLNLIAKYPGEMEGISQWYVRRWLVYGGMDLKSILGKPNQIYYGVVPIDLYGTFGNLNFDHDKRYFIAALDGETDQTSYISLTPKEYCEFIKLKTDYDNEPTR
jgi:hypothetical protein